MRAMLTQQCYLFFARRQCLLFQDDDGRPKIKYGACSDEIVLRRVGIAPCGSELRARRLRTYQRRLRQPQRHAQEIGAVFGQLLVEVEPTILPCGTLAAGANPYAWRFAVDCIRLLRRCEEEDLLEGLLVFDSSTPDPLSLNIRALFEDPEVRHRFLRFDPGILRAAARTVMPPETAKHACFTKFASKITAATDVEAAASQHFAAKSPAVDTQASAIVQGDPSRSRRR